MAPVKEGTDSIALLKKKIGVSTAPTFTRNQVLNHFDIIGVIMTYYYCYINKLRNIGSHFFKTYYKRPRHYFRYGNFRVSFLE
jgi:hypothetical protein